jgi:hypothetical protein
LTALSTHADPRNRYTPWVLTLCKVIIRESARARCMARPMDKTALMSPDAWTTRAGTWLAIAAGRGGRNGQKAHGVIVWSTGLKSGALARCAWMARQ